MLALSHYLNNKMSDNLGYNLSFDCSECSMRFENVKQLANHVKNFCVASPYSNMQGLIEAQQRDTKYNKVDPNGSHLIGDYGKQTLGKMRSVAAGHHNNITENALRNKQQELLDDLVIYQNRQKQLLGKSALSKSGYPHNNSQTPGILIESQVQSVHGSRGFISPPSMPRKLQQAKVDAQVNDMSPQERWKYAENKLKELESIKASYMENGGTDVYFLSHLESLYNFYKELKTAERASQVRMPSPVDKLRALDDEQRRTRNMGISNGIQQGQIARSRMKSSQKPYQQEIMSPTTGHQGQNGYNPYQQQYQQAYQPQSPYSQNPYQQPYPPVIIMQPPAPQQPPQQPNRIDSSGYLERLLSLKDDQNKKLLQLLSKKQRQTPMPPQQVPRNTSRSFASASHTSAAYPQLNADKVYGMQPIQQDLLPEQRVLISLEKQQLDQLRLLSMLPQQLQKIKFQTVKNMSELRCNLEKQLQQQRLERMKYQMDQQAKQENRLFENELWVDQQRKKALSQRLNDEALMM